MTTVQERITECEARLSDPPLGGSAAAQMRERARIQLDELTSRAKTPTWWQVTLTLYSDRKVTRQVTGQRPSAREIGLKGWHEVRDDGDECFIPVDAIAQVDVEAGFATAPERALHWQQVNQSRRAKA